MAEENRPERKAFRKIECLWCNDHVTSRELQWHFINRCPKCPPPSPDKRICSVCQQQRDLQQFPKHAGRPAGRDFTCSDCNRKAVESWRQEGGNEKRVKDFQPRPSARVMKPCPYCGQPYSAREMWTHRAKCPHNPKNISAMASPRKVAAPGQADPLYLRKLRLKAYYGITQEQYDQMLADQNGGCAICHKAPSGGKKQRWLHVDHSHETGKNRGLLCLNCNHLIGKSKEDPAILLAAIDYLRRFKSLELVS